MITPRELEERYLRFLDGGGDITGSLLPLLGEEDRLLDYSGAWRAAMLSRIYLVTGKLDLSLSYLRLSSRSFNALSSENYPFGLWINRALIMKYRGQPGRAERVLRYIHRLCLRKNQIMSAARASSNLAVLLARRGRPDQARSHLEFSRRVYSCCPGEPKLGYMDLVESVIKISRREFREAGDLAFRFMAGESGRGSRYRLFTASLLLAESLLASGRAVAALGALEKISGLEGIKGRFPPQKLKYLYLKAAAAECAGDTEEAERCRAEARGLNADTTPADVISFNSGKGDVAGGEEIITAVRGAAVDGEGGKSGPQFIIRSPVMKMLVRRIRKGSKSPFPILLTGPTGTGKSMIAGMIHSWSGRGSLPFVHVNGSSLAGDLAESALFGHLRGAFTGAVSRRGGLIEAAGEGTLFLDEIAELDRGGQARLLRFLDSGQFRPVGSAGVRESSARVVAATNRNMQKQVREGCFREDLYHRLSVLQFRIPPLTERREEILPLARHFLNEICSAAGCGRNKFLSDEAAKALLRFPLPGNIRQLRNEIAGAVFRSEGDIIRAADLSAELLSGLIYPPPRTLDEKLARFEEAEIVEALNRTSGNRAAAARLLGINRTTLLYRLRKLGIV